jgi:hypothetical protein
VHLNQGDENVAHFKSFYDPGQFLEACDLNGQDVVVEIESVSPGKVGRGNQQKRKPVLSFVGKKKKHAAPVTNGKIIARMYGTDVTQWVGKRITLYPTTCEFGGETVDCIRVRPEIPRKGSKSSKPDPEPVADDDEDDVPNFDASDSNGGAQ